MAKRSFVDGALLKEFCSVVHSQACHVVIHNASKCGVSSVPTSMEPNESTERRDDVVEPIESAKLPVQDFIGSPVSELPENGLFGWEDRIEFDLPDAGSMRDFAHGRSFIATTSEEFKRCFKQTILGRNSEKVSGHPGASHSSS